MKRMTVFRYMLTLLVISAIGCASSDSTSETDVTAGTSIEDKIKQDDGNPQAPMDPDTDMSAEKSISKQVSANNKIGREMNIVGMVQQNPNLSILLELIEAADLVRILESPAPYTVFAPTNAAFEALPAGTLQALKQPSNKFELTKILQSHILPNRITTPEMKDNMPMITAQGDEVVVKKKGNVLLVGDAKILASDLDASNGVIHVIDRVLLPPQK
jgi:uncharacterized surface protein with fasciclin (FAS1) repeats